MKSFIFTIILLAIFYGQAIACRPPLALLYLYFFGIPFGAINFVIFGVLLCLKTYRNENVFILHAIITGVFSSLGVFSCFDIILLDTSGQVLMLMIGYILYALLLNGCSYYQYNSHKKSFPAEKRESTEMPQL